jgi:hypothetical protein
VQEWREYVACFAQTWVVYVAWLLDCEIWGEDVLVDGSAQLRREEGERAWFVGVEGEDGV